LFPIRVPQIKKGEYNRSRKKKKSWRLHAFMLSRHNLYVLYYKNYGKLTIYMLKCVQPIQKGAM